MKKAFFVVLLAAFSVVGCHYARGPIFKPVESSQSDKALVYVYRPLISHFKASKKYKPYLFLNNSKIVPMELGGYTVISLEPGKHLFEIRDMLFSGLVTGKKLEEIELQVEAGNQYYLSYEQNLGEFKLASLTLLAVAVQMGPIVTNAVHPDIWKNNKMFLPVSKDIAMPELQKTRYLGPDENQM